MIPLPLVVFLAALLGPAPSAVRAAEPLPVVASTTVIADLVKNVGGDKAAVRALAPAGSDPHTFQPTPDSMKILARARIAFFNGSGLEEWWGKTVRSVGRKDLPIVELSKGFAILKATGDAHGHTHGGGADPHAWLDPTLAKRYVERIGEALSRADGANGSVYAKNAAVYQAKLDELDAWIRAEIATIPPERRKMITFHNAFQYFAKRYGLAVRGYIVASPGKEPSAKTLAELTRRIKQERIPAVFAEADFSPKLVQTLARDAGVTVVTTLYDGSLTDGPPAESYLAMMRHNATQIVSALR
jgi:ABC-type Zn uptake system ZnuABC Zn-binding protein ZnuA